MKVIETKFYTTNRYNMAYNNELIDFYPAIFRYDDFHKIIFDKKVGYKLKLYVRTSRKRLTFIVIDLEHFEENLDFYIRMLNYLYLRFYIQMYEE